MKNKFKKIITTTLLSVTATTALGCATSNTKIANKINNGIEDFVSSINNLDYVETNNQNSNLGKIVSALNESNLYTKMTNNTNIENTITRPTERSDNFKLYILSKTPYITLSSDDNNLNFTMQVSTEKIETTSDDINNKINQLILKRAILMVYVNEIYNGNINLTEENRKAINAYVNIIKENTSFLNGNRGMVKNQLGMASNLINNESEDNIINYYIIKSGEALEIRSNKIESSISAIDSIISILEQNLSPNSCYYQNNLTTSYQDMISKISNGISNNENEILAKNIAESINMIDNNSSNTIQRKTYPLTKNYNNQTKTKSTINNNCIDCDKITNNNSQQDNSSNNQNNNIQTLENIEENKTKTITNNFNQTTNKTQISSNSSEILNKNETLNNSQLNNDTIKRTRRTRQRMNRLNNDSTNQMNPTLNSDDLSTKTNTNNIKLNNSTNTYNPYRQNSTTSDNLNRATRLPYRVSTNNVE